MKHKFDVRSMVFLALCCDLGLVAKRLINPFANLITDFLRIPGGIGTSFSLMFLVIAVALVPGRFCGTVFGAVQSGLALAMGMVGSMGALSPIGYIVPGIAVDLLVLVLRKSGLTLAEKMAIQNAAAAICAALTANAIVFHLWGVVLLLYVCVATISGSLCGLLGAAIVKRVAPALRKNK